MLLRRVHSTVAKKQGKMRNMRRSVGHTAAKTSRDGWEVRQRCNSPKVSDGLGDTRASRVDRESLRLLRVSCVRNDRPWAGSERRVSREKLAQRGQRNSSLLSGARIESFRGSLQVARRANLRPVRFSVEIHRRQQLGRMRQWNRRRWMRPSGRISRLRRHSDRRQRASSAGETQGTAGLGNVDDIAERRNGTRLRRGPTARMVPSCHHRRNVPPRRAFRYGAHLRVLLSREPREEVAQSETSSLFRKSARCTAEKQETLDYKCAIADIKSERLVRINIDNTLRMLNISLSPLFVSLMPRGTHKPVVLYIFFCTTLNVFIF